MPVDNHSIFAINSCTKAFTGVAIMQLVEQGIISLEAGVGDYIDSLPEKWRQVKIWRLLTHISGFIETVNRLGGSYPEDILDELAGYYNPDILAADPITTLRMQRNKKGFDQALPVYKELQKARPGFNAPETELNDWAYRMMSSWRLKEATADSLFWTRGK